MLHVGGENVVAGLFGLLVRDLQDVGARVGNTELTFAAHGGASEFNFFGFSGVETAGQTECGGENK